MKLMDMELGAPVLRLTLPHVIGHEYGLCFRAIVECADDSVIVIDTNLDDPGPTIRYINPAFTRLTGYAAEDVVGRSLRILQGPASDLAVSHAITSALRAGQVGQGKVVNYGRDGKSYWVDLKITPVIGPDGRPTQFVAFQRECTADQMCYEQMRDLAERDALTGLASRGAFIDTMERHLASKAVEHLAFAFVDVDNFKQINDSHGHAVGDAMLMGFADVMSSNVRRADAIGRLGGEEFGICMPRILPSGARSLTARLRTSVAAEGFETPAGLLRATCSIGLAMKRPDDDVTTLFRRADMALHRAKHEGRNRVCIG